MTSSEVWMITFLSGLFAYGAIWTFTHSSRGISLISKILKLIDNKS